MQKNSVYIILFILLGLNILAWLAFWELRQAGELEVTFFDVGHGDAIFIEIPSSGGGVYQILIDGGPDDAILEKLGQEMPFWDRTINLIILTHPSADHLNGLLMVLERYKVNQILWTGVKVRGSKYREWLELIAKENAEIFIAQAGQRIKLGENVYLDILNPIENLKGQEIKGGRAINNTSIVARLVYGEDSFLFTGDIEKRVEKELLEREVFLDSDVLKVAHQGSRTSSSKEFIEAVSPEIAVIQIGKDNPFGHPHPEVLQTLEQFGAKILRTDIHGDIKIISNSPNYQIKQ